jgi:septum formation protein
MKINNHTYILASISPRRQFLLKELGLDFEVRTKETEESFPAHLQAEQIPLFLCQKKADAFEGELKQGELLITADTVVWVEGPVLNKPEDEAEAIRMLSRLSGKMHQVYTGVCLKSLDKTQAFFAETKVFFKELSPEEIQFYISTYSPYDKAGAYGAQDWIGLTGIKRIEGTYFNVMGLPMFELYEELKKF